MRGARGRAFAGAVAAAVVAMGIGACGSDEPDEPAKPAGGSTVDQAIERVPEGPFPAIYAVDLDAARAALGLPEDADPGAGLGGSDDQRRFAIGASTAIPHLRLALQTPIGDVLDASRISAAATNGALGGATTVIATDQPFEEIAAALEDAGYERDGAVLTIDRPLTDVVYSQVAGGDGFIALGSDLSGSTDAVEAAIAGDEAPAAGPERELIAELDGSVRGVISLEGDCLSAIAASDPLDGEDAEFLLVTEADARSEGFVVDDEDGSSIASLLEFGEPVAEGDRLTVPVTSAPATSSVTLFLSGEFAAGDLYDCDA